MLRARLRHLWRVAAVGCMMAYRLIQLDRRLVPKLVTYSIETNIDSDALVMLIRNYVPKRDMSLSARVREYFASERTDAQTEKMAQLLSFRLHSFGSYSPHQQRQLCQMMQYEIHPQGRLVVKEGHRPYAVYFILSGQLDVFTVTDNIKYRLNICKTGDSFGDRSFKIENDGVRELCPRRTASVSTMLETELLQVNREDYIRILMISTKAQQQENINRLLSLPHFCDDRSIVERIVAHAKFHRFEPHQVIVSEGSVPLSMFWILSGTCRCDKMMRVVRRKTTKGKEIVKLFVASQAAQAETDDKTSYELMTLFEFQPGDFFPAMPPALTTMVQEDDSCRLKYVFQLSEQEETGKGSPSHYTVISSSQVDVMSISHHDFAMFASCKMVCQALDDIRFKITADEIVAAFEQRSRWKEFRKEQIQQSRK
nr:hypothetical protein HK105_003138 [Polyrhizophydium stewartii]